MVGALLTLLATALSLLVVDIVLPGVNIATFPAALIAAGVLGLVNSSVRPVLSALSMPLNFRYLFQNCIGRMFGRDTVARPQDQKA